MFATSKRFSHLLILITTVFHSSVANKKRNFRNANNNDTRDESTSGNGEVRLAQRSADFNTRDSGKYRDCTKAILNKTTDQAEVQFEYPY